QRKNVGARVKIFAQGLLRRHVGNRAYRHARAGQIPVVDGRAARDGVPIRSGSDQQFRQAEVQNFRLAAIGQKNVRGLDVAVNDVFGVRGIQRVGGLDRGIEQRIEGQRAAG